MTMLTSNSTSRSYRHLMWSWWLVASHEKHRQQSTAKLSLRGYRMRVGVCVCACGGHINKRLIRCVRWIQLGGKQDTQNACGGYMCVWHTTVHTLGPKKGVNVILIGKPSKRDKQQKGSMRRMKINGATLTETHSIFFVIVSLYHFYIQYTPQYIRIGLKRTQ